MEDKKSHWISTLGQAALWGGGIYVLYQIGKSIIPDVTAKLHSLINKPEPQIPDYLLESTRLQALRERTHGTDTRDTSSDVYQQFESTSESTLPIPSRDNTSGLTPDFKEKLIPVLVKLAQDTTKYNQMVDRNYRWIVINTTGGKHITHSLHYTGNAVDLWLYDGKRSVDMLPFNPDNWEIMDILRCACRHYNLEWGGYWCQPFDPNHVDNKPYSHACEWRWEMKRPTNMVPWCDLSTDSSRCSPCSDAHYSKRSITRTPRMSQVPDYLLESTRLKAMEQR
jgi:hypothetical protein